MPVELRLLFMIEAGGVPISFMCSSMTDSVSFITGDVVGSLEGMGSVLGAEVSGGDVREAGCTAGADVGVVTIWSVLAALVRVTGTAEVEECRCWVGEDGVFSVMLLGTLGSPSLSRRGCMAFSGVLFGARVV